MFLLEKLDVLAFEKRMCEVVFWDDGIRVTILGIVDGFYDRDDHQILRMQSGQEIRYDKLIQVDGTVAGSLC